MLHAPSPFLMVLRVSVNSALQTEMFKNSEIPTLIFLTGGKKSQEVFFPNKYVLPLTPPPNHSKQNFRNSPKQMK